MTPRYLLDASTLIPLVISNHEHHQRAEDWAAGVGPLAICPIAEGALVRFLLRLGESGRAVQTLVAALHESPAITFWPDDVSYRELDLSTLRGHRQATDAYLVGLATRHDARLATLDVALAAEHPTGALLVP